MILFALALLICPAADTCRWSTVAHLNSEPLCHEIGREYLAEPTVRRFKCTATVAPSERGAQPH